MAKWYLLTTVYRSFLRSTEILGWFLLLDVSPLRLVLNILPGVVSYSTHAKALFQDMYRGLIALPTESVHNVRRYL